MQKLTVLAGFMIIAFNTLAQDNIQVLTKPIVDEGKLLYKSEMASWYGTDIFLEKVTDKSKIGGYFSYSEGDIAKCIFFSKGDEPKVTGTISFDSTYDTRTAKTDLVERAFTKTEHDLYTMRMNALNIINSDTLFKFYKNTNLNLIPIISNGEKKVYVLTGPKLNGVVIFGNDYLLTFDNENQLLVKKQLHKNIISVDYNDKSKEGAVVVGAVHSHLPETGDFITATDICTLMLYSKFAGWKSQTVVSENYISIWNCESNSLIAIPRDKSNDGKAEKKRNKRGN